jgi:microcystin-dependent protein
MDAYMGEIRLVGFSFVPRGWLACDGSLLSINTNSALFSLIGTAYGGDGKTTFALPDLRGRVAVDSDNAAYPVGTAGGEAAHALTTAEMPVPHSHVAQGSTAVGTTPVPTDQVLAMTGLYTYAAPKPPQVVAPGSVGTAGGAPHDNMQPYQAVQFVINNSGPYPPRN